MLLFYKVGPDPANWEGRLCTSDDGGASWSTPSKLPEGILGPIKNKPVHLKDGSILCPSSSEHDGWRVHFERTSDLGKTWEKTKPVDDPKRFSAIQPTLLQLEGGRLAALCRSRKGKIVRTTSNDGGKTWTDLAATKLPNPNSAIDAVSLADGRQLLVYNHADTSRYPLNLSISTDGEEWKPCLALEHGKAEYSYPAVIQSADGKVHVTYTWKRKRIGYVRLDPATIVSHEFKHGGWPKQL